VRERIVAFYTNLLIMRARPAEPRHFPGRRPDPAAVAAAAAAAQAAAGDATGVPDVPATVELSSEKLESSSD
jgi:hypothetical protein